MNISLMPMYMELCRTYMQGFVHDLALFSDPADFRPYVYDQNKCDEYFRRQQQLGRIHMAVMADGKPIGEVILKKIDRENKHCTLGICMQSDAVKDRGYGTRAERLILQYAFCELGMDTVYADALLANKRSQHVLEKVGFRKTHQDAYFVYYRCDKHTWQPLSE